MMIMVTLLGLDPIDIYAMTYTMSFILFQCITMIDS